jgi:hypothetical protein
METKNIKKLLLYLFAKSEYSEADKKAVAVAFDIPQNVIVVNSEEQKIIISELLKKE